MWRWMRILMILGMLAFAVFGNAEERRRENPQLSVFVIENSGLSSRLLLEAERSAARVFRMAGVDVNWLTCARNPEAASDAQCSIGIQTEDLVIRIVPRARTLTPEVFGVSFLDGQGGGSYADVFLTPIEQVVAQNHQLPLAAILGDVIAHELGHLLLGNHAHSLQGIMQAHWQAQQLHGIAVGRMLFTADQAQRLKSRVVALRQVENPVTVAEIAR